MKNPSSPTPHRNNALVTQMGQAVGVSIRLGHIMTQSILPSSGSVVVGSIVVVVVNDDDILTGFFFVP